MKFVGVVSCLSLIFSVFVCGMEDLSIVDPRTTEPSGSFYYRNQYYGKQQNSPKSVVALTDPKTNPQAVIGKEVNPEDIQDTVIIRAARIKGREVRFDDNVSKVSFDDNVLIINIPSRKELQESQELQNEKKEQSVGIVATILGWLIGL